MTRTIRDIIKKALKIINVIDLIDKPNAEGEKFQVLKYDDEGNPIDWDEAETAKLVNVK